MLGYLWQTKFRGKVSLDKQAPKEICEAVVSYTNAGRLNELLSTTGIDVPKGDEKFDFMFTQEGTGHFPAIYAFNSENDTPVDLANFALPNDEDSESDNEFGLVVYKDAVHILKYQDLRHPVASSSLSGDKQCRFKAITKEKIDAKALEPSLCAQLNRRDAPSAIVFDGIARLSSKEVAAQYHETTAIGTQKMDIANNRNPINIAQFHMTSGRGPGCDAVFFDQVDSSGAYVESGVQRDLLWKLQRGDPSDTYPIRPCSNNPKFFKYKGRVYFESKPAIWPPKNTWHQYHHVTRINDGVVEDVCGFSFATKVVIEREGQ